MKVQSVEEVSRLILLKVKLQLEIEGKTVPVTCQVSEYIAGEPETTNYQIGGVTPTRWRPLVLQHKDQIIRAMNMD